MQQQTQKRKDVQVAACLTTASYWESFSSVQFSSAEYDILSAEKETPEQLGARLHLMADDMGDHPVLTALPPGRAHAAVARWRWRSLNERPLGSDHGKNLKYDDR